jgi:Icc-related predicted phosphoesterase
MKVALFSDVHGRLRVVLQLIRNWQMAHKCYLDGALIAGDLGCFPDLSKVDKATNRWMAEDPEEAGFSKYFVKPQEEIENLFLPEFGEYSDIQCPIHFVPGNHEDFSFLNAHKLIAAPTFTVDCYRRFNCIQDGAVISIRGQDGNYLRVAGIWGIENAVPHAPYKINSDSIRRVEALGVGQFDVLLTHDAPAEAYPEGGSKLITHTIKTCQPDVHLFGHVHPVRGQHHYNVRGARTSSFILKDVSFGKSKSENLAGALGILDWDGDQAKINIVGDNWLKQMRYQTWKQVWSGAVSHAVH